MLNLNDSTHQKGKMHSFLEIFHLKSNENFKKCMKIEKYLKKIGPNIFRGKNFFIDQSINSK